MEASGADLDQAGEQDGGSEPVGNGVVVVVGMFVPGDVVSLIERGEHDIRAGSGDVVGRRVVDELGQVGFAGLDPGAAFFVCGYSAGRYQEVRCVAQDPAFGVTLFQPTVAAVPTTLGSGTAAPVAAPAAPNAALEVGLPEGVTSPLLTPAAPEQAAVCVPAGEAEAPAGAGEAATADPGVDPAAPPASPDAEPVAESPAAPEGTEPAADAASATTDDGSPLEAQGAGVDPAPVEAEVPAAETATDGADAPVPTTDVDAAPVADQPAPADPAAALAAEAPSALAQLVAQAEGLGIGAEGATDEAVLRQSITEKGATPVV